ncbi:unnamed protein product, partial [Ectocarpus sp. 12 AP-2014]
GTVPSRQQLENLRDVLASPVYRREAKGSAKPRSEPEATATGVDRGTVIDAKMATIFDVS